MAQPPTPEKIGPYTYDFGDESFQAITCTGTDNTKNGRKYTKNTTNRP